MNDSLLTRIVAAIIATVTLIASFIIGLAAALVALGLVVVGWLAMTFRMWQLRRKASRPADSGNSTTVEGEYRVIAREEKRDDR
jgi:uncharacterized protein (DUF58 family)